MGEVRQLTKDPRINSIIICTGKIAFFPQSDHSVLLDAFHQPRVTNLVEELKSQEI